MTVILAALEIEARAAARALGLQFVRGGAVKSSPPLPPAEVHVIGMRAVRLPEVLPLLTAMPNRRVLLVGLAGALSPSLGVGDLVYDSDEEGGPPSGVMLRRGRIHTADHLVASAADKRALFEQTGALAVDMEQSIVREALAPLGIAVAGLRAVSDDAGTSLPAVLPALVDALGRPRRAAVAAHLLRRPGLALDLARLGAASSRATRSLSAAIRALSGDGAT